MNKKKPFNEILDAVRRGDMDAFETLYHVSVKKFEKYLRCNVLKDTQEIEDVLQEAYVSIFQDIAKFKDADLDSFLKWGCSICRNIALHHLRTAQRHWGKDEYRPIISDGEQAGMDMFPAADERGDYADPLIQLEARETARLLDEMIGRLPDRQRVCIALWKDGYTMSEIAHRLDLPKGTVNSSINYAKKKIRSQILLHTL